MTVKESIEEILQKVFQEPQKRKVFDFSERLNFACPYCGDSKNVWKKRGNFYKDSLIYHCYNCGIHKRAKEFFGDFDITLSEAGISYEEYEKSIMTKKKVHTLVKSDIGFPQEDIMRVYHCVPAERNPVMKEYLESRRISDLSKFMYGNNKLFLLNMNEDKIVGIQIRTFGKSAKYLSIPYSKIYEDINGKPFDDERKDDIDSISLIFGRFYTDFSQDFYILEGFIDATFIQNAISMSGASRDLNIFDKYSTARYLYDNDETGRKFAMKALQEGKYVFMWKKFLDDWNNSNKKIKDINDLIMNDIITEEKLNEVISKYFTDDEMMIMYV